MSEEVNYYYNLATHEKKTLEEMITDGYVELEEENYANKYKYPDTDSEISTINEAIASNSKSILLYDLDSMWVLDALNGDRVGDWFFVSSTESNNHSQRPKHWNDLTFNYEEDVESGL
tara:strand:- start:144 stop:497 length:354 start_codon:yes stop_codon:yes gene_type:complete